MGPYDYAPRGGRGFTPRDLPGLVLWNRADVAILNGSTVSQWSDLSGRGRNWAQATAANQPGYTLSGIGTRPSLVLDASFSQYLTSPATAESILSGASGAERFCVAKVSSQPPSGVNNTGCIESRWGSGVAVNNHVPYTNGQVYDAFAQNNRINVDASTWPLSAAHIYDTASSNGLFEIRINGQSRYSTATNTFGANSAAPKLFGDAAGNHYSGQVSEYIVYNRVLSASERSRLNIYLARRYGIALTG